MTGYVRKMHITGFNNWRDQKMVELVFFSGSISWLWGGFRIELIVMGVGFVVAMCYVPTKEHQARLDEELREAAKDLMKQVRKEIKDLEKLDKLEKLKD